MSPTDSLHRAEPARVEIRLTHHARQRAVERGIGLDEIRAACLDPDRVKPKRLTPSGDVGLSMVRDFPAGGIEVIAVEIAAGILVLTVGREWEAPRTRRTRR